ncbi:hypothetical protein ABW636_08200 [Aquimarina sp. 2201CG1-2-11]
MKTKTNKGKTLTLKKLEISKITNTNTIRGGGGASLDYKGGCHTGRDGNP